MGEISKVKQANANADASACESKGVYEKILSSGMLDLRSYVYLNIVLKRRFEVAEAVVMCPTPKCGPQRFQLWERLFMSDSEAGSFLNISPSAAAKRLKKRRVVHENLGTY